MVDRYVLPLPELAALGPAYVARSCTSSIAACRSSLRADRPTRRQKLAASAFPDSRQIRLSTPASLWSRFDRRLGNRRPLEDRRQRGCLNLRWTDESCVHMVAGNEDRAGGSMIGPCRAVFSDSAAKLTEAHYANAIGQPSSTQVI